MSINYPHFTAHNPVLIGKVSDLPGGQFSNMSRHPIVDDDDGYENVVWPRAEHLFQALRFPRNHPVREQIRMEQNPMRAKMLAKAVIAEAEVAPRSDQDLVHMRGLLIVKCAQHADVLAALLATGDLQIVEDCSRRRSESGLFWGAARQQTDLLAGHISTWFGHNMLGTLWMELRTKLRKGLVPGMEQYAT